MAAGYTVAHARAVRGLPPSGMAVHAPAWSNCQPWYGHSRLPVAASMRPSERGTRRCGHASRNARHWEVVGSFHTTLQVRIVIVRVWHGRQRMVLERWTRPNLSRRTCTCEYGLHATLVISAGVAKRPRLPPGFQQLIRNLFIAAQAQGTRRWVSTHIGSPMMVMAHGSFVGRSSSNATAYLNTPTRCMSSSQCGDKLLKAGERG